MVFFILFCMSIICILCTIAYFVVIKKNIALFVFLLVITHSDTHCLVQLRTFWKPNLSFGAYLYFQVPLGHDVIMAFLLYKFFIFCTFWYFFGHRSICFKLKKIYINIYIFFKYKCIILILFSNTCTFEQCWYKCTCFGTKQNPLNFFC